MLLSVDIREGRHASPEPKNARICRSFETVVAAALAVPLRELLAPTRRSPLAAFARQTSIYLAHVVLGWNYTELGRLFGRDRTTVAHACHVIEERRDDPAVETLLQSLEGICGELARGLFDERDSRP
ncbi:MAG: helix-turn-helix domain-containing protein [Acidobacteriota bacterium]